MIILVNVRGEVPEETIYCGRACGQFKQSPLHNPYRGEGAIEKFKAHFCRGMLYDAEMREAVAHIIAVLQNRGVVYLGCWCKPKPCHTDVIKAYVEQVMAAIERS